MVRRSDIHEEGSVKKSSNRQVSATNQQMTEFLDIATGTTVVSLSSSLNYYRSG